MVEAGIIPSTAGTTLTLNNVNTNTDANTNKNTNKDENTNTSTNINIKQIEAAEAGIIPSTTLNTACT